MSTDTTSFATTQRFNYETNWLGNIKPGSLTSTNSSTTSLPDGIQTIADGVNAMTFDWDSIEEFKKWIDKKFQCNGDTDKIEKKYQEFLLSADRMDDDIQNGDEVTRLNEPIRKGEVIILNKDNCLTAETKQKVEELEFKLAEKQAKLNQMKLWNRRLGFGGGFLGSLGLIRKGVSDINSAAGQDAIVRGRNAAINKEVRLNMQDEATKTGKEAAKKSAKEAAEKSTKEAIEKNAKEAAEKAKKEYLKEVEDKAKKEAEKKGLKGKKKSDFIQKAKNNAMDTAEKKAKNAATKAKRGITKAMKEAGEEAAQKAGKAFTKKLTQEAGKKVAKKATIKAGAKFIGKKLLTGLFVGNPWIAAGLTVLSIGAYFVGEARIKNTNRLESEINSIKGQLKALTGKDYTDFDYSKLLAV